MAKTKNTQKEPTLVTRALLDTNTYNAESHTVEVTFATDAPVLTRDQETGELFNEVLSFDPAHVRMERLLAGAPVLDTHDKYRGVKDGVLGVVDTASLEQGKGVATLRFSQRKDLEEFRNDVKAGIIKNVSTGYRVYMYRDITEAGAQIRTLLAIDWEPSEISMVPVPADYKSAVRSLGESAKTQIIKINNNVEMTPEEIAAQEAERTRAAGEAQQRVIVEGATKAAVVAERKRVSEITEAVRAAKLDDAFATEHIEKGTEIDQVRALVIQEWSKKDTVEINANQTGTKVTGDDLSKTDKIRGIEEVLAVRAFGHSADRKIESEYGKSNFDASIADHARALLVQSGASVSGLNKTELITRAMASTDFPIAMANVISKDLKKRYTLATPVWKKFATQVSANDFKPVFGVQVDGSFTPDEITESGEYKLASMIESGDSFALKTYGKKTALTRKMMINDDLSAFTNFAPIFAQGMLAKQTSIVYALLAGTGRVLGSDSKTLFHVDHKNYVSAGTALSLAAFTLAKTAMRRQKSLAGDPILVTPKYLVIPPELEVLAHQLINSTITPNTTSQANPFYGAFEILVDPYLTSTTEWYIIADPASIEVIKYATLAGQEGIFTEQRYNFDNDNLEIKVRNEFNATIEEYRGIYKNVGA